MTATAMATLTTEGSAPDESCYLFAILEDSPAVRSACAAPPHGDDTTCDVVAAGGLCAAVGPVPPAFSRLATVLDSVGTDAPAQDSPDQFGVAARELEHAARVHEGTVERLAAAGHLLPVRMGTVFRTRDDVRRLLQRREDELTAQLAHVGGSREWGVRIWWRREAADQVLRNRLAGTAPVPASSGPGQSYLAGRRTAAREREVLGQLVAERADRIHALLMDVATDVAEGSQGLSGAPGGDVLGVLSATYLVGADEVEEFLAHLERVLVAEGDLLGDCSGPWPPYSFVEVRVEGEAATSP